jgi:uncharacterized protein with FMN-binding domain
MLPRRAALALVITAVAVALLFSFKTPTEQGIGTTADRRAAVFGQSTPSARIRPSSPAHATQAPTSVGGAPPTRAPAGATATEPPPTDPPASASTDGTLTGPVVSTRFGPVEVQITVQGGKIVDVTALELPSGRRSGQISQAAEPLLRDEALQAQSATIDIVSGATYTSEAYAQSLQAALDQAHG